MRLVGEVVVIIVGVLLALAADRWNQARLESRTEREYVQRLIDEIYQDSVQAANAIATFPRAREARDSLARVLEGAIPQSVVERRLFISAGIRFVPQPVMAWAELNSTGMLTLLDQDVRRDVASYYAGRNRVESAIGLIERRSRDPYFDALYPLGVMDEPMAPDAVSRFLARPDAGDLLRGLGGLYTGEVGFLGNLLEAAGEALQALRASGLGSA